MPITRQSRLSSSAARRREIAQSRSTTTRVGPPVDLLLEVPNLGLADGYGQSARPILRKIFEIGKEENISIKIVDSRIVCTPILREAEYREFKQYVVPKTKLPKAKVLLRYHLPTTERYGADRLITMTMFETDSLPGYWIHPLNTSDLVITPTEWGANIFRSKTTAPVISIPLPVNSLYYRQKTSDDLLKVDNEKFRFITVGNYFRPDRKRLIPLIETFGKRMNYPDCEMIVKTSWMDRGDPQSEDIHKACGKYDNITLNASNISTEELIELYLTSHAGLFPSYGEGYGMPHAELALLGRPLVVADNTALTTMANYMPQVIRVPCKNIIKANYSPQMIAGDVGHWFECNINQFIKASEQLYLQWKKDKNSYNNAILKNHRDNELRKFISHDNIKEMFRLVLIEEIGKAS